ncbi:hypothetical protein OSH39_10805 [Mycobacterium ulcerans]|uniref:hypothetical protein n=1 Tax=Mycobacterium ulcerans TaxID=1809 RepID=UPI00031B2AF5|nr:hypothetical protein [Mycobacterium ulcerans]MEB3905453.1 hypothetical protein [Mycobacterium ulcerans]MEB3909658.1 hypothetical protein [Mycobacterium ulcerans]MEB3919909.1 hypothetical protein [Mycobacterium ulcerans]MEB3923966.1 hypothetical protein [Mycobacterium ulcerans]MEB3928166.1 hypothetical protein [Mycobacterium ulcerans]
MSLAGRRFGLARPDEKPRNPTQRAWARCGPAILLEGDSLAPCAESADPAAPPDGAEVCKH